MPRGPGSALRVGPARQKEYVLGAFTDKHSPLSRAPAFRGVVVSDRYQNYFHPEWAPARTGSHGDLSVDPR